MAMDPATKALEEMSRAQSDYRRKYGEPDPHLQRRIDALMKRKGMAKATPKKKKPVSKKGSAKRIKKSDLQKRYA